MTVLCRQNQRRLLRTEARCCRFATMRHQIQEMLWIEGGGAEQLPDELAAYNPLIPQGRELVATFMIEIDDPIRRKNVLARLAWWMHQEDQRSTAPLAELEQEAEKALMKK